MDVINLLRDQVPMQPETKSPNVAPSKTRRILRRFFKCATLAFLFVASCLTILGWATDSHKEHALTAAYGNSRILILTSRNGGVWFGDFLLTVPLVPGYTPPSGIEFQSYDRKDDNDILKIRPPLTKLGAGIVHKIELFNSQSWHTGPLQRGLLIPEVTLDGFGIILPHWMLLFGLVSLFLFIAMGRRFTLRMFLIWVTIACVSLAIAVRNADASAKLEQQKATYGN